MYDVKENRSDGFILGVVYLAVAYFVAVFARMLGEMVASWFFEMPDISNLGGNADYFFTRVYPVMFLATGVAYFGALWIGSRLIGSKIGYKYEYVTQKKKSVFQLAFAMVIAVGFSLWFTLSGEHELVSWYLSATLANLFGMIDPQSLLAGLQAAEIGETFRIASVTPHFVGLFFVCYALFFAGTAAVMYFGRKQGENAGVESRKRDREELHASSGKQEV